MRTTSPAEGWNDMTRLYLPTHIDYDLRADEDTGADDRWVTREVRPVAAMPVGCDADQLMRWAAQLAASLRDFAERTHGTPPGETSQRYGSYQRVRAMVRDGSNELLVEVRADGTVLLPGELSRSLRRQFIGMINGWLPMLIRELDKGEHEAAISTLARARSLIDTMLGEVVDVAANGPARLPRQQIAELLAAVDDNAAAGS
jgi:hypothetical protein